MIICIKYYQSRWMILSLMILWWYYEDIMMILWWYYDVIVRKYVENSIIMRINEL